MNFTTYIYCFVRLSKRFFLKLAMIFFIRFQTCPLFLLLIVFGGCSHWDEKEQIRALTERSLAEGPVIDETMLGIKFGDSRISYRKKLDSLYEQGVVHSLMPDSSGAHEKEAYQTGYFYIFAHHEPLKETKWILLPVFEHNRLVKLELITNPVLEKSPDNNAFDLSRGIVRNIIDTSREVKEDSDLIYRITKDYFSQLHGTPGFVSDSRDSSYWFKGNCVISIKSSMTMIRVVFKNSKLK